MDTEAERTLRLWCFISFHERKRLTLDLLKVARGVGSDLSWPPEFFFFPGKLPSQALPIVASCMLFTFTLSFPPFGSSTAKLASSQRMGRRIREIDRANLLALFLTGNGILWGFVLSL